MNCGSWGGPYLAEVYLGLITVRVKGAVGDACLTRWVQRGWADTTACVRAVSEALSRSCGWLRSETICCLHTCYISKGLWPSPTVLFFGGYYVPAGPSQRQPARNSTQQWPPSLGNCEALGFLCPARCSDPLISIWGSPTLPLLWVTSVSCRLSSPPHGQGSKTPHTSCPCALRTSTTQCQRSWCPSGSPTTWTQ